MKAFKDFIDGFGWACEEALEIAASILRALRISSLYEAGQVFGLALIFLTAVLGIAVSIAKLKAAFP